MGFFSKAECSFYLYFLSSTELVTPSLIKFKVVTIIFNTCNDKILKNIYTLPYKNECPTNSEHLIENNVYQVTLRTIYGPCVPYIEATEEPGKYKFYNQKMSFKKDSMQTAQHHLNIYGRKKKKE